MSIKVVKPRSRTLKRDTLRKELAWAKAHPHSIKTTRYRIITPTLRRLELAAMRAFDKKVLEYGSVECLLHQSHSKEGRALVRACAAHARALKVQSQAGGKRRKRE